MMSLSIPGSANLCWALIAESGKEPVGNDLVLTKRGESFNFTYPGKWGRDAQGQVRLGILKPPLTLNTGPEGQRGDLPLVFVCWFWFLCTLAFVKTESQMLQSEFQSRTGNAHLGSPIDCATRWPRWSPWWHGLALQCSKHTPVV